jgi:hypothetical protein
MLDSGARSDASDASERAPETAYDPVTPHTAGVEHGWDTEEIASTRSWDSDSASPASTSSPSPRRAPSPEVLVTRTDSDSARRAEDAGARARRLVDKAALLRGEADALAQAWARRPPPPFCAAILRLYTYRDGILHISARKG